MHDNQREVTFRIYQGESREVKNNVLLGSLNINVPPRPAGEVDIEVRFSYTVDGILETECTVLATGEKHQLVIENSPGALNPEELQAQLAKLAALKVHPRDQMENTFFLNRGARLYQESLGRTRIVVGEALSTFRDALESQNPQRIALAQQDFRALLNELEGEVLL